MTFPWVGDMGALCQGAPGDQGRELPGPEKRQARLSRKISPGGAGLVLCRMPRPERGSVCGVDLEGLSSTSVKEVRLEPALGPKVCFVNLPVEL